MINAVPKRHPASELRIADGAACATCGTREPDEALREWVLCPMVGGRPMCLGCCLDFQGVARDPDFDTAPDRDLFDSLATPTGGAVDRLRRRCLGHQREIVVQRLSAPFPGDSIPELERLGDHLRHVLGLMNGG